MNAKRVLSKSDIDLILILPSLHRKEPHSRRYHAFKITLEQARRAVIYLTHNEEVGGGLYLRKKEAFC